MRKAMITRQPLLWILGLFLALTTVLGGCESESDEDDSRSEVPAGSSCASSEECNGGLCILDACRSCVSDDACAQDVYGFGATCVDGACNSCFGELGCSCDAQGQCQGDLTCEDGFCVDCATGQETCACFGNDTCHAGLRCNRGACEVCPPGERGCACDAGEACGEGLVCMEEVCVEDTCELGAEDCPCGDGDSCEGDLVCSESGLCAVCSPDIEGCACAEDGTCGESLVCGADDTCRSALTCADLTCAENQLCEPQQSGADAYCLESCNEGFSWNSARRLCEADYLRNCRVGDPYSILEQCGGQNRRCIEDAGASCGGCLPDYIDENGALDTCRRATTCEDLGCDLQNRLCTAHTLSADASCGECGGGFEENNGACIPVERANCDAGAPLSILEECRGQHRVCEATDTGASCGGCEEGYAFDGSLGECTRRLCEDLGCASLGRACGGEPLAACGACLEGLLESDSNDPSSACREPEGCGGITCDEGSYCVERKGADATCSNWPCLDVNGNPDPTSAFREDINECVYCGLLCDAPGETGQIWPFTLEHSDRCICETEENYYVDVGGALTALPCDEDGDGWLRRAAEDAFSSTDPALVTNARCQLQTVDRFRLINELGQKLDILLCVEGLVEATSCESDDECNLGRCDEGTCGCIEKDPLEMFETARNDDQDELDEASPVLFPSYQYDDGGRRLRASEVNPLTRACVSATADFNDNGATDVSEYQGQSPDNATAEDILTTRFSFFVELHKGYYERELGADYGRYVIQERSRCDGSMPITYDSSFDGDYWKGCTRFRDDDYDTTGGNLPIGFDFAAWTCDAESGACKFAPPTDESASTFIPDHDICSGDIALPPADGVWRGMNHHSQFKCVLISDEVPEDRDGQSPHIRDKNDLTTTLGLGGAYQLNRCRVGCPEGDETCNFDCNDEGCATSSENLQGGINSPVLTCETVGQRSVNAGTVGFAAIRYDKATTSYTRGCINEWTEWPELCPGYANLPQSATGEGNTQDFGNLSCGCGYSYGGQECELFCLADNLHHGGDCENAGDSCDSGTCYCPTNDTEGRQGWWMCGELSNTSYEDQADGVGAELLGGDWSLRGSIPKRGTSRKPVCINNDCDNGLRLE